MIWHNALFSLAVLWGALPLCAAVPIILNEKDSGHALGRNIDYLEDRDGNLTIATVSGPAYASRFNPGQSEILNFSYTPSTYWLRFSIDNRLNVAKDWLLEVGNSHLNYVSLCTPGPSDSHPFYCENQGNMLAFAQRTLDYHNYIFKIVCAASAQNIYYLRVKTTSVMRIPVMLWTPDKFMAAMAEDTITYGIIYGIAAIVLIYSGFFYITIRDKSFLLYFFAVWSYLFFLLVIWGHGFQYFWPHLPAFNDHAIPFAINMFLVWACLFVRSFLQTNKYVPTLDKIMRVILAVTVGLTFLSVFLPNVVIINPTMITAAIFDLIVFVAAVVAAMHYRPARFFIFSNLIFLLGAIIRYATQYELCAANYFTLNAFNYGAVLQSIVIALALGDKVNLEQKAFAAELAATNNKLNKANSDLEESIKVKTMFFNNTSHELRTPLNGILGYINILTKNLIGKVDDTSTKQLGVVGTLARDLLYQVNAILDIARGKRGELRSINSRILLDELAEEISNLATGLLYKYKDTEFKITTNWQPTSSTPYLIGDREKLASITRNLLGNAFKFKKPNEKNLVMVRLEQQSDRVLVVQITDNGVGIPLKMHEKIFEEFVQVEHDARRRYEGSGLGLSIVKQMVGLMNGTIELESTPGIGSTFTITIPNQQETDLLEQVENPAKTPPEPHGIELAETATPSTHKPSSLDNRYQILVIDDNVVNCHLYQDILSTEGYVVDAALSGKEGLRRIGEKKPDLIILDMMMPEVSGEDVLKCLKGDPLLSTIPVIVVTARASEEDRILGLRMGADDYLAKPIIGDEMTLRVANMLTRIELTRTRSEKVFFEQTLATAQKISQFMIDANEKLDNVSIEEFYRPAEQTSGDWYCIDMHQHTGRIYLILGDVTGHGIVSAMATLAVAGTVKGVLSIIRGQGQTISIDQSLGLICSSVNSAVWETSEKLDRGMTMIFSCLDLATGVLTYCNAGHTDILWINRTGAKVDNMRHPMLGFHKDFSLNFARIKLDPGDVLFYFTDGLIENHGPKGHTIHRRQLHELLKIEESTATIKANVISLYEKTMTGGVAEDDCTFFVLKWLGSQA